MGRLQQQATLSHANLLGLGDRLQVGFNRTEGSQGFNVGYALPINSKNGTLSFSYGNSRGQVIEEPFQDLDIKSRSQTYEIAGHVLDLWIEFRCLSQIHTVELRSAEGV